MSEATTQGTAAGNGSRLRCEACRAEAIVMRAAEPGLSCCGQPLTIIFRPGA